MRHIILCPPPAPKPDIDDLIFGDTGTVPSDRFV